MAATVKIEQSLCRLCGEAVDNVISIFNEVGEELKLQRQICRYLPIQISEMDSLPQGACYTCVELLQSWDSFVTVCLQTDAKLRGAAIAGNNLLDAVEMKESMPILNNKEEPSDSMLESHVDTMYSDSSDNEPLITKVPAGKLPVKKRKRRCKKDPATSAEDPDFMPEEVEKKRKTRRSETDEPYLCDHCGRTFRMKTALSAHVKSCSNKEGIPCTVCGLVYRTAGFLEKHMDREHNSRLEECNECHNFVHAKKLRQHLKTMHNIKSTDYIGPKEIPCKYCDMVFFNRFTNSKHFKTVHLQEIIQCESCDFSGRRDLVQRHVKNRHTEKTIICSQCPMTFKTYFFLKEHMKSHSNLRSYTCDICGKGFKRLNNVKEHVKSHQAKTLQCQICGKFFQRKRYLAIHEKTIHNFYADGSVPEKEKGFECTVCGTRLKWKKNLMAHMRIHTGEKPYWCKICNKAFICHGALRSHMNKHDVANATTDPDSQSQSNSHLLQNVPHPPPPVQNPHPHPLYSDANDVVKNIALIRSLIVNPRVQ